MKYLGSVAILIILLRASCLTHEINEFGCYEAKVHIEDCEGGVTNRMLAFSENLFMQAWL